ncbi:unnamed protein product [Anisakis simplex]|uniref:DUF2118 domain-containing protein n=1 Tax=Anisakis simplex TaxID=6269 RepID=A0A0M3KC96_ANISI|nr:unnamed protein product [Anisakis simplex]
MHMDVSVKMIVFHPTVGHPYRCTVASIGKYLITAKIFDAITFVAPIDATVHSIPNVGDVVSIEFREVDFKKSLCQMKGVLVARRKEKTNKVTFVDDDDDDDGKG